MLQSPTHQAPRLFLGLARYFRRFMPEFSALSSPLTDLTRKGDLDAVQWSGLCQQAFVRLKAALCGEPVLRTPNCCARQWGCVAGQGGVVKSAYRRCRLPSQSRSAAVDRPNQRRGSADSSNPRPGSNFASVFPRSRDGCMVERRTEPSTAGTERNRLDE